MKKLIIYNLDRSIHEILSITLENIEGINGMKTRCSMDNQKVFIGYASCYGIHSEHYPNIKLYLSTFDYLDEVTHQLIPPQDGIERDKYKQSYVYINIDHLTKIEAIRFSNPRWRGLLTNEF